MSKNPKYDWAFNRGKLEMYHNWSDLVEQWHDEAEELGYTDQWQIDSYMYDKTVKWMDAQRAEAELQCNIANTKLEHS